MLEATTARWQNIEKKLHGHDQNGEQTHILSRVVKSDNVCDASQLVKIWI